MGKNKRVGRKKNRLRNELESLGIDINNIPHSGEEHKLPTQRVSFGMLRHYCKMKDYKSGWAIAQFRSIFGEFPNRKWNSDPLTVPNHALKTRVIANQRAYYEGKPA